MWRRAARMMASLGLVLAACGQDPGGPAAPAPAADDPAALAAARARAEQAAGRLMTALMAELSKALEAGPPEGAVRVCADAAQAVTARVAGESGIAVRRTALRVRNPKNAPDEHERRVLEEWAAGPAAAATPRADVVAGAGGARELRYLRPIVLQPLCTTCHGPAGEIAPAVRAAIAERYPDDQATGFRAGDLRGAVSVRVPLPTAGGG